MKFNNYFFLVLLIFLGIVFSACSDNKDCSSLDSTYKKYGFDEDQNKCVVIKEIEKNKCGNGIKEDGETYCNCPKDINQKDPEVGCFGKIGEFVEKGCSKKTNECVFTENNKVILEEKKIEFKNSNLNIVGSLKIKNPYILNLEYPSEIEVNLNLFTKRDDNSIKISNIIIENFEILDSSNNILAKKEVNEKLNQEGSKITPFTLTLSEISEYKKKIPLKPQISISYEKNYLDSKGNIIKTERKREILKSSIGSWEIINPNFYSKK